MTTPIYTIERSNPATYEWETYKTFTSWRARNNLLKDLNNNCFSYGTYRKGKTQAPKKIMSNMWDKYSCKCTTCECLTVKHCDRFCPKSKACCRKECP